MNQLIAFIMLNALLLAAYLVAILLTTVVADLLKHRRSPGAVGGDEDEEASK